MAAKLILLIVAVTTLLSLIEAGGHGGGGHHHKKIIIHVPYKVHHHHHKHTITKHIHHKPKESGGDHYEVLGYTYGEPKHGFSGGGDHGGWGADEVSVEGDHESPISFASEGHDGGLAGLSHDETQEITSYGGGGADYEEEEH